VEQRPPSTGPFLQMAVLCEKVLQEADGVSSIIRVVDRIVSTAAGPEVPASMPPLQVNLTLALMFKSGTAQGRSTLTVRPQTPAGIDMPEFSVPVLFEGGDRGVNVFGNLVFQAEAEGVYWITVLLDGEAVTQVPLRILYQPMQTGYQGSQS